MEIKMVIKVLDKLCVGIRMIVKVLETFVRITNISMVGKVTMAIAMRLAAITMLIGMVVKVSEPAVRVTNVFMVSEVNEPVTMTHVKMGIVRVIGMVIVGIQVLREGGNTRDPTLSAEIINVMDLLTLFPAATPNTPSDSSTNVKANYPPLFPLRRNSWIIADKVKGQPFNPDTTLLPDHLLRQLSACFNKLIGPCHDCVTERLAFGRGLPMLEGAPAFVHPGDIR
jgi:hypothetical protein